MSGRRWAVVVTTTVLCVAYSLFYSQHIDGITRPDYDQLWGAGRALLSGRDPYASVCRGCWFDFHYPLYYPLTAVVAFLPLAFLPLVLARAVFAGLCGLALSLAVTKDGLFRTPALLSFSFLCALQWGQLAPLLAAALVYPWLGGLVAVKPTSGLAVVVAQHEKRDVLIALAVAAVLTLVSLLISPRWPFTWFALTRDTPHLVPMVMRWGGVLLLGAWLRWRRPEARWLGTLAIVPITSPLYESVPLFMAPLTFKQSLLLALLSHVAGWATLVMVDHSLPLLEQYARGAVITIVVLYLPALVVVLRQKVRNAAC